MLGSVDTQIVARITIATFGFRMQVRIAGSPSESVDWYELGESPTLPPMPSV